MFDINEWNYFLIIVLNEFEEYKRKSHSVPPRPNRFQFFPSIL